MYLIPSNKHLGILHIIYVFVEWITDNKAETDVSYSRPIPPDFLAQSEEKFNRDRNKVPRFVNKNISEEYFCVKNA
jgi:hypothetical protein